MRKGSLYIDQDRLDEAEHELERALILRPGYAHTYFYLGKLAMKREKWTRAVSCLQKALILNPDLVEAHFHLARVHEKTGDIERAVEEYRETVSLQVPGKSDLAEKNLERILKTPRGKKATDNGKKVTAVRFDTPLVFMDAVILAAVAVALFAGAEYAARLSALPGPAALRAELLTIAAYFLVAIAVGQYVRVALQGEPSWFGWRVRRRMDDALFGFTVLLISIAAFGMATLLYHSFAHLLNFAVHTSLPYAGGFLRRILDAETAFLRVTGPGAATFVLMLAVAPVAEELLFRGVFYTVSRKHLEAAPALILNVALFAAARWLLTGGVLGAAVGLGCVVVYEKRMTILSSMVFNVTWNALLLVAYFVVYG